MSNLFYCEHCNNKFNNNGALNKHKRIAKYCLIKQGKIEDESKKKQEEREKMEREKKIEKERMREQKFRCEYCKIKFTTRINLCGHLDICLVKYKKIIEEKEKEKEKIIEENKIEKEKIIEEKEKEKEKIIEENKIEIIEMKNKWRVKKEKLRKAGSRINIKNNNSNKTTINNINQTVKIVLQSIDLSEENIKKICSYYGREDFLRGSIGAARFIQKNIMTTKEGDPTAVCTDIARKMFYVNINGKQIKDPSLHIFYSKIDSYMKKEYYRVYIEENECIRGERRSSEEITEDRYRDILNRNKVMKRLAEMAYVQSSKLQITQE